MKRKIFGFKTILTILLILLSISITYLAKEPSPKIEVVHKEIDIKKK